jgi:ATP-dependent Clp protease ATP-binding subunit ClpC
MEPRVVDLPLRVAVLLRASDGGDWTGAPVADPSLVAFGPLDDVRLELQLYLEETLAQARPEVLSRFAYVEGTELELVPVPLPLLHLPDEAAREAPTHEVSLPAVVIPSGAARWISLPDLSHTLFAKEDEVVADVVARDAPRFFAARGTTPDEHLRLFPPRVIELEVIELNLARRRAPEGGAVARKALKDRVRRQRADEILRSVATPLHELDLEGPEAVGHDELAAELSRALTGDRRAAVALVGEPGVGKTALLHRALRASPAEERPRVYATSGARLIAGMSGRGQWEERMRRVLDAVSETGATLYFDDLADLFTRRGKGSIDLAGALKPYLDAERARILGELRPRDVERCEAAHVGVFHAFRRLAVPALDEEETRLALDARRAWDEARRDDDPRPVPEPSALSPLVSLLERFGHAARFPGPAVKLYDELRASRAPGEAPSLTASDVYEAFSLRTGIPSFLLREDHALVLEEIVDALQGRVVGQADAVRLVAETLCVVKAGLAPRGRPLASFLFAGPTGVGKTEVARALAGFLFGDEQRMIRLDMSEYMDAWAAERLIHGSGGREEGVLTRQIKRQPFSVILLDEIEKAHPAVFDLLLQVLGEGRLTDARGDTASFENAIVILTSNLGATDARSGIGFGDTQRGAGEVYARAVEERFRPEFVARLDRVVVFHPLEAAHAASIARLAIARAARRRGFVDRAIELDVDDRAVAALAARGHSEADGARALRRHLERALLTPAARVLSAAPSLARGGAIRARAADDPARPDDAEVDHGVAVWLERSGEAPRALRHVDELSRMRRDAEQHLGRDRVGHLAAQLDYLLAQMSTFSKDAGRLGADLGDLMREHERVSTLYRSIADPVERLCEIEEEALIKAASGDAMGALAEEASAVDLQVKRALLDVLLRGCARPDRAFLLAQGVAGGGLERWLSGLAGAARERRWDARAHVDGDRGSPSAGGEPWSGARRFGPPRPLEDPRVARASSVIVEVRGPRAGAFVALEGGIVQFHGFAKEVEKALVLRLPPLRADHDEDWSRPRPLPPERLKELPVSRWRSRDLYAKYTYVLGRYQMIPFAEYWRRYEEIALVHLLAYEDNTSLDPADVYRVSPEAWPAK